MRVSQGNRPSQGASQTVRSNSNNKENLELDLTRLLARTPSVNNGSPDSAASASMQSPDNDNAPLLASKPGYIAPPLLPANFTIRGLPNETIRIVAATPNQLHLAGAAGNGNTLGPGTSHTLLPPLSRGASYHQDNAAAYLEAKRTSRSSKSSRH